MTRQLTVPAEPESGRMADSSSYGHQPEDDVQIAIQTLLCTLLGLESKQASAQDIDVIQQLAAQDKLFNALFDFSERIYEQHAQQLNQYEWFTSSPLIKILQQNRIALYANIADLTQNLDSTLLTSSFESQQTIDFLDDLEVTDTAENNPVQVNIEQQSLQHENLLDTELTEQSLEDDQNMVSQVAVDSIAANYPDDSHAIESIDEQADSACQNLTPLPEPSQPTAQRVIKMPHFQIPNARVGTPYQGQIKSQKADQQIVQLKPETVILPDELGITYDLIENRFYGIPVKAGEYAIAFDYFKDGEWLHGHCTLIVTADPRSLWQVKEPAEDQLYPKSHSDHQCIHADGFTIAAASRRGRSHEHAGSFRDDDFLIKNIDDTPWSILAVADGAGSAAYSREGSKIVVNTVGNLLTEYIQQHADTLNNHLEAWQTGIEEQPEKQVTQALYTGFYEVFHQAAMAAIQAVEQIAVHHALPAKAFATTLLIAVVRQCGNKTFVCSLWVGDGAIAVYSPDRLRLMGAPDTGEFAGQTQFLDKSVTAQFDKRVNIGYFENIYSVMLMTDGISDPKFETDNGLLNQHKWNQLWDEIKPCLAHETPDIALHEWMHFFSAGHHDDRTLAMLWSNSGI